MVITHKVSQPDCDKACIDTISQSAEVVTGIDASLKVRTGQRAIITLFNILHRRACRLVPDREVRWRLHPLLRKFVCNLVMYFKNAGELDDFNLANIVTALSLADRHSNTSHGPVDYSTLIRRPNPLAPDSDNYFVVGREGNIGDPECPIKRLEAHPSEISQIPREQLDVFFGFYHARRSEPSRGAPKISVRDFAALVPREIRIDPVLEEAFTDVCLSDGAWDLYYRRVTT